MYNMLNLLVCYNRKLEQQELREGLTFAPWILSTSSVRNSTSGVCRCIGGQMTQCDATRARRPEA